MLTDKQQEAALKALEKAKSKKLSQYMAMLSGAIARSKIKDTYLPYRILYDFEKRIAEGTLKEVAPNTYYPSNGRPFEIDCLATSLVSGTEEQRDRMIKDPDYQKKRLEYLEKEAAARTPASKWEYYNAHFLSGYDIQSFKPFDFSGKANTKEEDVSEMRKFLINLQSDYLKNPEKYFSGVKL